MINVVTEPTPNPATMKFVPGCPVMAAGTANFPAVESAANSPLAARLFAIGGVSGVFLGADFISVAKGATAEWASLEPAIRSEIAGHFESGDPVLRDAGTGSAPDTGSADEDGDEVGDEDGVVAQIRELLDTRVRPSVALDGGDIVYRGFERGVVYLSLQGACVGCPSSTATLKMGVENLLRHYVPDVIRVEAVQ